MVKSRKPNLRRRRKTRRRQRRGGKVIGMGGSGFVHYGKEGSEHVVCADGSEWKEGDVAKIGGGVGKELARVESIRKHYPKISEFAILPTRVCAADPKHYQQFMESQPESDTKMVLTEYPEGPPEILFSPYGGTTVETIVQAPRGTHDIPKLIKALRVLQTHVKDMNANRVYHTDIKTDNMVYKNDTVYLIDFGRASVVPEDEDTSNLTDVTDMEDAISRVSLKLPKAGSRTNNLQRRRSYQ